LVVTELAVEVELVEQEQQFQQQGMVCDFKMGGEGGAGEGVVEAADFALLSASLLIL
jgi:hypothetical protein